LSNNGLETLSVNTIRTLCMDAIQAANSGHPGTPRGIAPVAYTLWQRFLRFDPADPIRPNRDRFVLSEGHASASGPLGQGVATSVRMAIAGQWLAARYDRDDFTVFDVYAMAAFTKGVAARFIGYGSPVDDTPKAHGEPFGVEGVKSRASQAATPAAKCSTRLPKPCRGCLPGRRTSRRRPRPTSRPVRVGGEPGINGHQGLGGATWRRTSPCSSG
jgi:transketolase